MATARVFRRRDVELLEGDEAWDVDGEAGDLLWVDLESLEREATDVARRLGMDAERLERPRDGDRAGFRDAGGWFELTLRAPSGKRQELVALHCLVGPSWVVTAHERPISALEDIARQAGGSGPIGELDGPDFVAVLFEWMLGAYEDAFDSIEHDLEQVDLDAMRGRELRPDEHLRQLVALRAEVGTLRRALVQHRGLLALLSHPEFEGVGDEEAAERFTALRERFREAHEAARDSRGSVVNSFDVLIARTEQRTNEIVKLLTILSFVLLPGSMVAGLLGMNFDVFLFDWSWLFWVVLGALMTFVATTLVVARRRGWV